MCGSSPGRVLEGKLKLANPNYLVLSKLGYLRPHRGRIRRGHYSLARERSRLVEVEMRSQDLRILLCVVEALPGSCQHLFRQVQDQEMLSHHPPRILVLGNTNAC
jgi:hypothetical protein